MAALIASKGDSVLVRKAKIGSNGKIDEDQQDGTMLTGLDRLCHEAVGNSTYYGYGTILYH